MISSKFCIEFFFRYNSNLLIKPIPNINFEEFFQLLLPYSVSNITIFSSLHDKFQEALISFLEPFFQIFNEILEGSFNISQILEGLLNQFSSFIQIEYKSIYLYNQAKLFLFKEIDYLKLSFQRLLNFFIDLDKYVIKALKKQALLDLFHKACSQTFKEILTFQPILEKEDDQNQTYEVFMHVKDFIQENLLQIENCWLVNTKNNYENTKQNNDNFSENLTNEFDEPPNKFDKSFVNFQASKFDYSNIQLDCSHRPLNLSQSQIEIELKNMNYPLDSPTIRKQNKKNSNEFFIPLKTNSWDAHIEHKSILKPSTKSVTNKNNEEESLMKKENLLDAISQKKINSFDKYSDFLDPKNSFRRNFVENSKYQVKTKVSNFSSKAPVYTQINGVIFTDPLYLISQTDNKEDFSLFNGLIDEDIDESREAYTENSLFSQNMKTDSGPATMTGKDTVLEDDRDEQMLMTGLSPKKKVKKKNSKTSPKQMKKNNKVQNAENLTGFPSDNHQISDFNQNHIFSSQMVASQNNINLFLLHGDTSESSMDELNQNKDIEVSPLVRRQNWLKTTFLEGSIRRRKNTISTIKTDCQIEEYEVLLQEPEMLKAISLSCGLNNNKSSVNFFSKWNFRKEKKESFEKIKYIAKKKIAFLRKIFKYYIQAKYKYRMVNSLVEFIKFKIFLDPNFLVNKAMDCEEVLLGKAFKQGQGDTNEIEKDTSCVFNRKIKHFKNYSPNMILGKSIYSFQV